ncbi:MAG TPA: hypothetical protein VLF19_06365 [Methylomirabilota bacterium]|nr:hypothetical protein [Methylomirabilota bacterium]
MTRVRLAVLGLLLAVSSEAAGAASLTLGDPARQEALRVGQRSVTSETFGTEWRVVNGGGESVSVMTPFHRLALAARHSAFKNEPLNSRDQDRLVNDLRDRLMLWVELHGDKEDFARFLAPRLSVGDRIIQPSIVQNERTAIRGEGGRYLARCVYWFPVKDVDGDSRVTLLIQTPEGQERTRFEIDLAKMR